MKAPRRRGGSLTTIAVIAALHALGVIGLLAVAGSPGAAHPAVFIGLGLTAYALGLRHAFDADHIAVIDNTTRRLLAVGRPSRAVGLWFSTGHSTIVVALCVALVLGVNGLAPAIADGGSSLHRVTSIVGPTVSGVVIIALAVTNVVLLLRARRRRDEPAGGLWSTLLRRTAWVIDRPWRMYLVGLAFGLGFDTATEISLLGIAAGAALGHASWYAVLTLPLLFAAGMSLLDSAQGATARRLYLRNDAARSSINLVLTGASALVAAIVGVAELSSVAADNVPALDWLPDLGTDDLGFALTGVLVAAAGIVALRMRRRTVGR